MDDKGCKTQILVAEDAPLVKRSVASLSRQLGGLLPKAINRIPQRTSTYYYPYYFQSFKASISKRFGRAIKVRLLTGVNGMNKSVGPAKVWPVGKDIIVVESAVLAPCTSKTEAEQLSQEYVDKLVRHRYRPSKPPTIEKESFKTFYVPYYVYARKGQSIWNAVIIEGFTGARARVKDVPAIHEAATTDNSRDYGRWERITD